MNFLKNAHHRIDTFSKTDEGMWIPMLIGKNYEQMKKQGFKLTAKDLYNANGSSLKDAILAGIRLCLKKMQAS